MRIENTAPERKPTRTLYDAETMGSEYEPPGITFNERDGTVARIKESVGPAVAEKFDHLELVEAESDDADAPDSESDSTADADTDTDTDEDESLESAVEPLADDTEDN